MVGFPMIVPGICNGPPWAATVTRQAIAPASPRRAARPLSPFEGIEHGPPLHPRTSLRSPGAAHRGATRLVRWTDRSEEDTSELQSLMRTSYAVFCLQKKK